MIFKTANSGYEVDSEKKRIRRLYGTNPPTGNFQEDGVWRDYVAITEVKEGHIVWVEFPFLKITRTTPVTAVYP